MTTGNQFDDTPIRPTSNVANETIRWAPSGVKTFLGRLTDARGLEDAPQGILDWLNGRDLIRTGRGSRYGKPVFTDLGKQVHHGIQKKMEGRS